MRAKSTPATGINQIPPWVKSFLLYIVISKIATSFFKSLTSRLILKNFEATILSKEVFTSVEASKQSVTKILLFTPLIVFLLAAAIFYALSITFKLPKKYSVVFTVLLLVMGIIYAFVGYGSFSIPSYNNPNLF